MLPAIATSLPLFVIPGGDFPAWAPFAFGAIALASFAVIVYQAVRYFRDNPGDGTRRDERGDDPGERDRGDGYGDGPGDPPR
ncbi:hypothetical protein [Marisediminicola senii]|uniref:hypothetical protein n=1 Tax=Marisediminicola senii TaxID=2711233 RepID=UPI0013EC0B0C|nr:hypothetical protein [Marisediminicola senii]